MSRSRLPVLPLMFVAVAAAVGLGASLLGPVALAVVPAAVGGFLLFFNPTAGVALLAFTIPLEAVFLIGGTTITKLVGVFVVLSWIVFKATRRESWWHLITQRWIWAALLFVGAAGISLLWAQYLEGTQSQLQRLVLLTALAIVLYDLLRSWSAVEWIVRILVLSGISASLLTLNQTLNLGVRRGGEGVSGGINATAMALVTLMPLGFYLIRSSREHVLWRVAGILYLAVGVLAVATTLSRMGFLLIPFVVALVLWEAVRSGVGRTPLTVMVVATVITAVVLVPTERVMARIDTIGPYIEGMMRSSEDVDQTVSGRGYHLKVAFAIFADNPFTGAGFNTYGPLFRDKYQFEVPGADRLYTTSRSAHSSYPRLLAELGLPGLLLWTVVLVLAGRGLYRGWYLYRGNRGSREFMLVHALSLAFLVQLLIGFYQETHISKMFWLILGVTLAMGKLVERDAEASAAMLRRRVATPARYPAGGQGAVPFRNSSMLT